MCLSCIGQRVAFLDVDAGVYGGCMAEQLGQQSLLFHRAGPVREAW